jgi:CHAD domain-containing protein
MKTESHDALAVHLARSLRDARRSYRRRLKRCRKKFSEKAVHDLRVETRRLLALLDFLEAAHFDGAPGKTRKILKQRLDAFDELRDTQVHLQLLNRLWPEFPEAKPLRKLLRRHEQRLIKQTRKKVLGTRQGQLTRKLKELEKQIRDTSTSKPKTADQRIATATLRDSFDRVVSLRRRIRGDDSAAIHRMRVAFKRFRYMSELLQLFLPWLTKERIRRMRKFQASAGDIQDLEILLAKLDQFVQEKEVPAATLGKLRSELSRRKEQALDSFGERIDDLLEFRPGSPAHKTPATT